MKNNIKIKYDAEGDVLSLELSPKGKIEHASEVGDFIVHFTKDSRPVLLEVLEASKFLKQSKKTMQKSRTPALAR